MGFIRFILAYIVVIFHFNGNNSDWHIIWAYTAVPSFFIISGFYMALIVTEKYAHKQKSNILFLTNRFLRIYPMYWIILIATIIYNYFSFYAHSTGPFATSENLQHHGFFLYTSFTNIISDFSLLLRTDYFNIHGSYQQPFIVPPAWSLVVELIFYLSAPFLVKIRFPALLALLIGSLSLRYGIIYYYVAQYHYSPAQVFFPQYLIFFVLGICSYRLYSYMKKRSLKKKYLSLIFLYVLIMTLFLDKLSFMIPLYKIEITGWLYFMSLVFSIPAIFLLFKKNKVDRFIGELSYPVYLFHMLGIQIYQDTLGYHAQSVKQLIIVSLAILAGALIVLFVNKPIENYRKKRE